MNKSTSISAFKVGSYGYVVFASSGTMPGPTTGTCLKFEEWTDKLLYLLELHFFPGFLVTWLQLAAMAASFILFSLEADVPVHKVWSFKHPLLY